MLLHELLGAAHSFSQEEDLNFTEFFSCLPETASTMTLLHSIPGAAASARTILHSMPTATAVPPYHSAESQAPNGIMLQQEHSYRPRLLEYNAIRSQAPNGIILQQEHSYRPRFYGESSADHEQLCCERYDIVSSSCRSHHAYRNDNIALRQDLQQERVIQYSHGSLDEGSASSVNCICTGAPAIGQQTMQLCTRAAAESVTSTLHDQHPPALVAPPMKKRKRATACMNSEDLEIQRLTHIAVERNRRKQMNEHLRALRSLLPDSYIQRGDQASIVGGAVEFVRELEQVLFSLRSQKPRISRGCGDGPLYPQQARSLGDLLPCQQLAFKPNIRCTTRSSSDTPKYTFVDSMSSVANVEVKMIGSLAIVKVLAQKKPHQLLNALSALENLHLNITHLNITTIEQSMLYSFNLEVEGESQIHCASDITQSIESIF